MSSLRQTNLQECSGCVTPQVTVKPAALYLDGQGIKGQTSVARRCLDNTPSTSAGMSIPMVGALSGSSSPHMLDSDVSFERFMLGWAADSGLFGDPAECLGASRYIQTAYRLFPEMELREVVAKYMLLVAVGDVLLDKRLDGEGSEGHQKRLALLVDYLRRAFEFGTEQVAEPNVPGAAILTVVIQQWQVLLWRYAGQASREAMRHWIAALDAHYVASVREWLPEVVDNPLVRDLQGFGTKKKRAMDTIRSQYVPMTHGLIATRIEELVHACRHSVTIEHPAWLELRLWMYLLEVNTIGAGLAFRTAAMALPEARVPTVGLAALQKTLPLLDMRIRLANDASGFFENAGQDRDEGKVNSYMLLISDECKGENGGVFRAPVMQQAEQIFQSVCGRVDAQLDVEIAALARQWPEMGQWVARGRKIGVRAYEVGHYTTLDRETFTSLLEAS